MNLFYIIGLMFWQVSIADTTISIPNRFAVPVCIDQNLNPSHLKVGNSVKVKVSYDLFIQGYVVFKEGTPVNATIVEASSPGILGKPSLVVIEINNTVASDGTMVPLSGSIRAEGEDRMIESIGITAFYCCLGVFIPGGSQSIGKGVGTIAITTDKVTIKCKEH